MILLVDVRPCYFIDYAITFLLGANQLPAQHPLPAAPWTGSGAEPGGSAMPFLPDGGKVGDKRKSFIDI